MKRRPLDEYNRQTVRLAGSTKYQEGAMSQLIQLLPGLLIHFAADGCWIHFDGARHRGAIHLSNVLGDHPVVGPAVREWIQRMHEAGGYYDADDGPP